METGAHTRQADADSSAVGCDETFRHAFESAPVGMAIVGLDGRVLRANAALQTLTGRTGDELLFMEPDELAHPDDAGMNAQEMRRALTGGGDTYRLEKRWSNASGHTVWVTVSASLVRDERARPLYFIWHVEDASIRKREHGRLQRRADHDALTGLMNRQRFCELLAQQVARCRRYGEEASVLLLDLDGFKQVNDLHGHAAGDRVLQSVARALLGRVRETDVVARLGGDEFAVLLLHVGEQYTAEVANEVRESINSLGHDAVVLGVSVGAAFITPSTADPEAVLNEADRAMYEAKRQGRGVLVAAVSGDGTHHAWPERSRFSRS